MSDADGQFEYSIDYEHGIPARVLREMELEISCDGYETWRGLESDFGTIRFQGLRKVSE